MCTCVWGGCGRVCVCVDVHMCMWGVCGYGVCVCLQVCVSPQPTTTLHCPYTRLRPLLPPIVV